MSNGTKVDFDDNNQICLKSIEERNLIHCKYLNLNYSMVTHLCTQYLCGLRILILRETDISSINTIFLSNLEYLDISWTRM